MGKRKERRRAALSNTSRRVKLDLFAEPSGNLHGSLGDNEVGGDQTQSAGLPNSPSSSGQQSQNPLLLLGQYSDDEMDEESNKLPNHATEENTPPYHDDQVLVGEEDNHANALEDLTNQKLQTQDVEKTSIENQKNSPARVVDPCNETGSAELLSVTGTSDVQVVGDVSSGWTRVLHAESNQYYYWNTVTGESSWEVPEVLSQSTDMSSDHKNLITSDIATASFTLTSAVELGNSSASLTVDGSLTVNLLSQCKEVNSNGGQIDEWAEEKSKTMEDRGDIVNGDQIADAHHNELTSNSWATDTVSADGGLTSSQKHVIDSIANGEHQKATDICMQLVKQCESLLEKLKSLQGSKGCPQNDWVQKHILEVEIRLSDIKSLLSYGSPLLPFWEYSERQLKRLEAVINNEIYELAVFAQMDDVVPTPVFSSREDHEQEGIEHESKAAGNEHNMISSSIEVSPVSTGTDVSTIVEKKSQYQGPSSVTTVSEQVDYSDSNPKPDFNGEEDVDMDMDMEVDDAVPAGSTASGDGMNVSEQPIQSAVYTSFVSEDVVPPPPDEEWIPPPPLDNDQVPPPPPDEPPEIPYPSHPAYVETGQQLTYPGQYNLTCQDPSLQYYGHFYGHVGVPQTSLFYEAVGSTYGDTAPVVVNAVETAAYYGIQDGTVPPVPGCNSVESSQFYHESHSMGYDTHTSDQIASSGALNVAGPDIIKAEVCKVGRGTENGSAGAPSTSVTIQAPATTSVKENITAPSEVTASSLTIKAESKVPPTKKRNVSVATSFRSSKKVSSLVDKWKAAKEELNEAEEEEPRNALEVLEKKRQRKIEEWKAQQIATGEARDNANFQPLGGDWRERVKRRRAKAAREATVVPVPGEVHSDKNRKPDLAEISKDLPSGWQAFWDDSSKKVYYGNTLTSETSWTKPTK